MAWGAGGGGREEAVGREGSGGVLRHGGEGRQAAGRDHMVHIDHILHAHVISLGRSAARKAAAVERLQKENVSFSVGDACVSMDCRVEFK